MLDGRTGESVDMQIAGGLKICWVDVPRVGQAPDLIMSTVCLLNVVVCAFHHLVACTCRFPCYFWCTPRRRVINVYLHVGVYNVTKHRRSMLNSIALHIS
jgi:hypothetical protein